MPARLRLEKLKIKNYKSIKDFELLRDGLAWSEARIPDVCLIGGANGSGKTSLLEVIYYGLDAVVSRNMGRDRELHPWFSQSTDAELVMQFSAQGLDELTSILLFKQEAEKIGAAKDQISINFGNELDGVINRLAIVGKKLANDNMSSVCGTGILYFPSKRQLSIPSGSKGPGRWKDYENFIWKWDNPSSWERSIEQHFYTAKYADLLSKENGSEHSHYFDNYQQAFQHFFQGAKELAFSNHGDLFVRCHNGSTHGLEQLSSGEQQILVLLAELHYRWLPNAIVLFDEPELHLHEQWLSALWESLLKLRSERGGQLIVATQSDYLFRNTLDIGKVILR